METNKSGLRLSPRTIVEIYVSDEAFMFYSEIVDLLRRATTSVKPWRTTRGRPVKSGPGEFNNSHNTGERNGRTHYRVPLFSNIPGGIGVNQLFAYTEFVNSIMDAAVNGSTRVSAAHAVVSFEKSAGPRFADEKSKKELGVLYWGV